jgi:hypothetical protein
MELVVLVAEVAEVAVLQILIMVLPSQIHHNHFFLVLQSLKEEI